MLFAGPKVSLKDFRDDSKRMQATGRSRFSHRRSVKVMQDELYTVKVRITPAWARYIGEKIWHESQRSRKLRDGSLTRFSHETERLRNKAFQPEDVAFYFEG